MKKLLTPLLILSIFSTSAQKICFTDNTNHWVTKGATFDCILFNRFYSWGADTIIHGITYRQMIVSLSASPTICPSVTYGDLTGYFLREDTVAGKVYYVHYAPGVTDTFEHTLYNYRLNVGDTIRYYSSVTGYIVDSVTSIDSVNIGGVYHKILSMQNGFGMGTAYYTIIEGIGCSSGPLVPSFFVACFEYDERVICFSQGTHYPVITALVSNLCVPVFDTFRNSVNCVILEAKKLTQNEPQFIVAPNPVNDYINITTTGVTKNVLISINDLSGRSILRTNANEQNNTTTINTSQLPNGLYILSISDNAGIIHKEKITILH